MFNKENLEVLRKGIGGHQSANMRTDEWLTPIEIIRSLGEFDLDPCSPISRPWDTAKHHFSLSENGLLQQWFGRVWMNPPYGSMCKKWLEKITKHGNGIALIFARTETEMFFRNVWTKADSIFFFQGRLNFYTVAGIRSKLNAGAPNCLVAYGENNIEAIEDSGLKGKHLRINAPDIVIVGMSPTWKAVVSIALSRIKGPAKLRSIYELVEMIAPDKIANNPFYHEKIRQTLQKHFTRVDIGVFIH